MFLRRSYQEHFDEVCQIDTAWLRDLGMLRQFPFGMTRFLSWDKNDHRSLSVRATTGWVSATTAYLELDYSGSEGQVSDRIGLEGVTSNLGRGIVWFFVCPVSGKRCRKLYFLNGRFRSRHAFPSAMYRSQVEPRSERGFRRLLTLHGTLKTPKIVWDDHDPMHFRRYYRGKPTKRYQAYLERGSKLEALLRERPLPSLIGMTKSKKPVVD